MAEGFSLPGRQQLRHVVRQRRQPAGDFPLALLGLTQLVGDVQGREDPRPVGRHDPPPRGIHTLAQRPVLLFQVGDAAARLRVGLCYRAAAPGPAFFELGFGLDGARAPAGQLVRHVAEHALQLVEHSTISPLSVVRQAHPPAPSAPAPTARPPRARAASESGRGTCNATRRCADPPARRRRDIRRTPPAARAGVPSRGPGLRPQPRRSPLPATTAPRHARPAAAWAGADTARRPAAPSPAGPRTRIVARPRPGNRPRGSLPAPLLPRPVAPPPTRPQSPLPVARYSPGRRPPPLTQSGASSPICPYQVLSHCRTNGAAAATR